MKRAENPILITGGTGALGSALVSCCENINIPFLAPPHSEFDITHRDEMGEYVRGKNIKGIIHAAAVVDWAKVHDQPDLALETNCYGVVNISQLAKDIGAHMVYISTDAVFPGEQREAGYTENDTARDPVSFYGMTKLMGEWACRLYNNSYTIARLGWLLPVPCYRF